MRAEIIFSGPAMGGKRGRRKNTADWLPAPGWAEPPGGGVRLEKSPAVGPCCVRSRLKGLKKDLNSEYLGGI